MARYTILDNQRGKNLFFNGRDMYERRRFRI